MTSEEEAGAGHGTAGLGRVPLAVLLLIALLVPLLGMAGFSGVEAWTRWSNRDASLAQRDGVGELARVVEVRAAVADEETYSTVVALVQALGAPLEEVRADGLSLEQALDEARRRFDVLLADESLPRLAPLIPDLRALRTALDEGEAGYEDVSGLFADLNGAVEEALAEVETSLERAADRRPQTRGARARLRALRETVAAFSYGNDRIGYALDILVLGDGGGQEALEALLRSTNRFEGALERAVPDFGEEASLAWAAFRDDPASQRTEARMDDAVGVALGRAEPLELDPQVIAPVLQDGAAWADRTIDLLRAVGADLEVEAEQAVADDTRAVVITIGLAALVSVLAAAVAVAIGRALRRVAVDLEEAARQIELGEFELPPLRPGGSREMAATVAAFNDMAATLVAVERHAVALAEEPQDPILQEPLPGRTGQAMQSTLDNLQESIQQAERHREALQDLATHDPLTGLLNRRAAFEALERDLARAARDGTRLVALYVDLDGLKPLNDTYGHAAGDAAIRRTAHVLAEATRRGDVVARLGGDEFLVAGPVPDGADGEALLRGLAHRVHEAISSASVEIEDGPTVPLRASVGVAASSEATRSVEELVRAADAALYAAKRAGRHQIAWDEGITAAG
ncbi:MAG: diguanylate cyclase [Actinomycetota bacterium]